MSLFLYLRQDPDTYHSSYSTIHIFHISWRLLGIPIALFAIIIALLQWLLFSQDCLDNARQLGPILGVAAATFCLIKPETQLNVRIVMSSSCHLGGNPRQWTPARKCSTNEAHATRTPAQRHPLPHHFTVEPKATLVGQKNCF